MTSAIPAFLRVLAITRPDGTGEVTINGTSHPITAADTTSARQACLDYVQTWVVDRIGRTVRIEARDHTGTHHLYLHVGGQVTEAAPTGPPHPDLEPAPPAPRGSIQPPTLTKVYDVEVEPDPFQK